MRNTEVTNEDTLDQLHGELMSVVLERLGRAVEPIQTALIGALGDALGQVLSSHGRDAASLPFLRAYMYEVACEVGRYDQHVHVPSLGADLEAILESRISCSAIAA